MMRSITLLGSSSGRNAGDAALMSGIMDAVDSICGTEICYEIPTIKPSYVRENYRNQAKAVPMLPWNLSLKMLGLPTYQSLMRTDLSLIFDAILFDRALYNPLFNFLSTLALLLPLAKKRGKKMAMYNVGIGPVNTRRGQEMLRDLAELMDFITVRDQDSFDILQAIGVRNPRILLTADAALTVAASDSARVKEIYQRIGLEPERDIFAVNVNAYIDTWASPDRTPMGRERFVSIYAAALNQFLEQVKVPLLFVSTQHHDVSITKEVMGRIRSSQPIKMVTNVEYNHYDIKGVLSRVSLLFAMRLHAMILASSDLTPVLGLAYQPKCEYYFRTLGMPDYVMNFAEFSQDSLVAHMLKAWENRAAIKAQLAQRIPFLKQEAGKAARLVEALRAGRDLDTEICALDDRKPREATCL